MLEVKKLNAGYRGLIILRDVTINVNEGEIISIIGANGSGKTTLLKSIIKLTDIISGSVKFLGEDLGKLPTHEIVRSGICYVPERGNLFNEMTVLENLEMGSVTVKDKEKRMRLLRRVFELFPRLKERKNQLALNLSGGERKMLTIGRALLSDPKLLLIDELSLGLAPMYVRQLFNTVERLARSEGKTILLVDQNVHEALRIADRGYVLENGRIVLGCKAKELMNNEKVKEAYLGMV